jgi:TP901 family phage tail tape measure protein
MKLADIFLAIGADDSGLDGDLKKSESKTLQWVGGLAKVTAAAIGTAVLAAGAIAADGLIKYTNYEKKISEVFTLLPDLSQQAMDSLSADARAWSAELGILTDKSIPALYQAISAGVPPDNVFDWLTVAQKAAVGGVTELETAVDGISSVVNAYGQEVMSAQEASDLMFTAVKLGKTDFGQLSASLFNVIPTAASLKVEFGDVTAALAAMTAQGTPTSVATTQMRQLLVELSKDGSKAAKEFERISGKSFPDFIAAGGNTADALDLIEKEAKESNKPVSAFFSSVEAGNAALALTGSGAETYRNNLAAMADSAGATDKAFETMEKTSARAIERLQAKMEKKRLDLGEKLEPGLAAGLRALEKFADSPTVAAFTDKLLGGVERVGNSLGMLIDGDARGAVANLFGNEAADKAMVFFSQVEGFFTNTLLPGVTLLRQAGASFAEFFGPGILSSVGAIGESFGRLFSGLLERAQPVIANVFGKVSTWLLENGPLIEAFTKKAAEGFDNLVSVVLAGVEIISPLIGGLVDVFLGLVTFFMQIAVGDWAGAWKSLQGVVGSAVGAIWETIMNLLRSVPAWFGSSMDEVKTTWSNNWKMLGEIVEKLKGAVVKKITDMIDDIKRGFQVDWGALGRNIIDGIAQGITSGLSKIRDAAVNAAKAALEGAKDWLQSHSPSQRAADEVGEPISDGTALGVERRAPQLRRSLQDSLKDALGGVGDMSIPVGLGDFSGAKLGAGNVSVTIQQNMPLMLSDEYTLERLLEPIILRIFRKAQADA